MGNIQQIAKRLEQDEKYFLSEIKILSKDKQDFLIELRSKDSIIYENLAGLINHKKESDKNN